MTNHDITTAWNRLGELLRAEDEHRRTADLPDQPSDEAAPVGEVRLVGPVPPGGWRDLGGRVVDLETWRQYSAATTTELLGRVERLEGPNLDPRLTGLEAIVLGEDDASLPERISRLERTLWPHDDAHLERKVEDVEAALGGAHGRFDDLEGTFAAWRGTIAELPGRVGRLEQRLHDDPTQAEGVAEDVRLLDDRLAIVEARLARPEPPVLDRVGAELELHRRLEALEQRADNHAKQVAVLDRLNRDRVADLAELDGRLDGLEEPVEHVAVWADHEDRITALEVTIDSLIARVLPSQPPPFPIGDAS